MKDYHKNIILLNSYKRQETHRKIYIAMDFFKESNRMTGHKVRYVVARYLLLTYYLQALSQ